VSADGSNAQREGKARRFHRLLAPDIEFADRLRAYKIFRPTGGKRMFETKKMFETTTFRCAECGYLESYTTDRH
jgi:hypothetical protein